MNLLNSRPRVYSRGTRQISRCHRHRPYGLVVNEALHLKNTQQLSTFLAWLGIVIHNRCGGIRQIPTKLPTTPSDNGAAKASCQSMRHHPRYMFDYQFDQYLTGNTAHK